MHRGVIERYLARQTGIPRHGRAALLTAGPPGAGKTTVLPALTDVARWRRLDAVTIIDVEVSASVARDHAVSRWWAGRQERILTGRGMGGRFTPSEAISRAFPAEDGPSVCRTNARDLFDSPIADTFGTFTLTVFDATTGAPGIRHTDVLRRGRLQAGSDK